MSESNSSLAVFDTLLADVTIAVKPILEIKVTDSASEMNAKSAGGQISALLKQVEARRKELLAPLKAQVEAINAAAKKVEATLTQPDAHIRTQLNVYSAELTRQRNKALQIQREKEELARKAAEELRRQEEEALYARQEAERKEREAAYHAEQDRIRAKAKLQREQAEKEAAERAEAAAFFGASKTAQDKVEREAAEAKRKADEEAAAAQHAATQRAADERRALDEQQERERLAEEARVQREESERQAAAEAERKAIEAQRVKGAKTELVIEVVDAWSVPRELCKPPEVLLSAVKAKYRADKQNIPGLTIREESRVSLRSQAPQPLGALA